MKKNILIGVVSFLMLSCGDNKELSNIDYTPVSDCNVKVLKTVYVNKSSYYDGKGWHTSFSHILLLNGYKEDCFTNMNFSEMAKRYVDSCSTNTPVSNVGFIGSEEGINFKSFEPDLNILNERILMEFKMEETSKTPKINGVYIRKNGFVKYLGLNDCEFEENFMGRPSKIEKKKGTE